MLRKIRTILAAVLFTLITLLFLDFTGTLHHWLSWLAKIQFLPAVMALNVVVVVALIVLTLVFGRIYCSVICPLGVFQDVLARFRRKKHKYSYSKEVRWLRRIATMIFQPIWKAGNNLLAMAAEHYESYAFYTVDTWMRSLPVLIIAAVTLVALFVLAWRGGRTYCNTVCPVGTILSFFARFSWFKVHFDADKCKSCSLCSKNCKSSCIDYKTHTVDYSRCVVCGNCIDNCKFGALRYDNAKLHVKAKSQAEAKVDASKRSFIVASALVTTAAMAQKKEKLMDGGLAEIEDKVAPERQTPLTPPGSLSFDHFAQHCTGCQLCVSDCPNQVLRPSSDLMHLMLPVMSYERGHCRPECIFYPDRSCRVDQEELCAHHRRGVLWQLCPSLSGRSYRDGAARRE